MLLEEDVLRLRSKKPVPVQPTLVICLGDFGYEVGKQLVARLTLTEESLKHDGLGQPLLVKKVGDEVTPGLMRIMYLDWNRWFQAIYDPNYRPDELLSDISIANPGSADEGTPPRWREEDRPLEDFVDARDALTHSRIAGIFETVSLPLRTHDTPMRMGPYEDQGCEDAFAMRVIVVCAARETASAELVPDIIRVLSKIYVIMEAIAKGIQIICYVGGTSREEHCRASRVNGKDKDKEFDDLLDAELARILPSSRRAVIPSLSPAQVSLLDKLDEMCRNERPQMIEACYLIDSRLANHVAAVQQRADEPDETVVAAALAINMLFSCDADRVVRQASIPSWDIQHQESEPGPFATFGVASFSLDHPRLRRLVYNYIVGNFLERAQPIVAGDDLKAFLLGESVERLTDPQIEDQLFLEMEQLCTDYKKSFAFKTIERVKQHRKHPAHNSINYRKAINTLMRLPSNDANTVYSAIEGIFKDISSEVISGVISRNTLEQQYRYKEWLERTFQELYDPLFRHEQGPLTCIYRFSKKSLEILQDVADEAQAPPTHTNLEDERKQFAERESYHFKDKISERARVIRFERRKHPGILNLGVRALLFAPVLVLSWSILSSLLLPLLIPFGGISFSFAFTLPIPSFWMISVIVTLFTWGSLFLGYRWRYHVRLRRQIKLLEELYKAIINKANEEAWRWALTQHLAERRDEVERIEKLCRPRGTISQLRDKLLAEQFVARNRILERIFFDAQLQADLKEMSQRLAASEQMWEQRYRLLHMVIGLSWRDIHVLESWLRDEAGEIYKGDASRIVDLVERFLKYQTAQRLKEIWYELSNAAALFLRRSVSMQDDPTVDVELFGIHNMKTLQELENIVRRSNVEILGSVDRLRWLFMHAKTGMHLRDLQFSVESQIP